MFEKRIEKEWTTVFMRKLFTVIAIVNRVELGAGSKRNKKSNASPVMVRTGGEFFETNILGYFGDSAGNFNLLFLVLHIFFDSFFIILKVALRDDSLDS